MPDTLAATVVMPTYNHGETIRFAVQSVLSQTVADIELFIVGDGVPAEQRNTIDELVKRDHRVKFFDFEKHTRRGEPNRHQALQQAKGNIVAYICDRDLWLPDHLERLISMLAQADFAHSLSLHVLPGDQFKFHIVDLNHPLDRQRQIEASNSIAFSCSAHTMATYRALPHGWRTTPGKVYTDWYMFRQILSQDGCVATSGTYPSAITFPSPPRLDLGWGQAERVAELERWSTRLNSETRRSAVVTDILQQMIKWQSSAISRTKSELHQANRVHISEISVDLATQLRSRISRKVFDIHHDLDTLRYREGVIMTKDATRQACHCKVTRNHPSVLLPDFGQPWTEYYLLTLDIECPYLTSMCLSYRLNTKVRYSSDLGITSELDAGKNKKYFLISYHALARGLRYELASILEGNLTINKLTIEPIEA